MLTTPSKAMSHAWLVSVLGVRWARAWLLLTCQPLGDTKAVAREKIATVFTPPPPLPRTRYASAFNGDGNGNGNMATVEPEPLVGEPSRDRFYDAAPDEEAAEAHGIELADNEADEAHVEITPLTVNARAGPVVEGLSDTNGNDTALSMDPLDSTPLADSAKKSIVDAHAEALRQLHLEELLAWAQTGTDMSVRPAMSHQPAGGATCLGASSPPCNPCPRARQVPPFGWPEGNDKVDKDATVAADGRYAAQAPVAAVTAMTAFRDGPSLSATGALATASYRLRPALAGGDLPPSQDAAWAEARYRDSVLSAEAWARHPSLVAKEAWEARAPRPGMSFVPEQWRRPRPSLLCVSATPPQLVQAKPCGCCAGSGYEERRLLGGGV